MPVVTTETQKTNLSTGWWLSSIPLQGRDGRACRSAPEAPMQEDSRAPAADPRRAGTWRQGRCPEPNYKLVRWLQVWQRALQIPQKRVWVWGGCWFWFSLGAQDLRFHPLPVNFGPASRGHEEAKFACFAGIPFPSPKRRNRETKLHFVGSGVSNQVADWEGRSGGVLPNEGKPRTYLWVSLYFRVFLLSPFIFCTPEDDECREQTWLCPLAVGTHLSSRERSTLCTHLCSPEFRSAQRVVTLMSLAG